MYGRDEIETARSRGRIALKLRTCTSFAAVALLSIPTQVFGQSSCSSVASNGHTWVTNDGDSLTIFQSPEQALSGSFVNAVLPPCLNQQTWYILGAFGGGGGAFNFTVSATTAYPGCSTRGSLSGTVDKPGCNSAHGTWFNNVGLSGLFTMTKQCDVPTGETSTFVTWDDLNGNPGFARWRQTLTSTSIDFGGRSVSESSPQGSGSDTCWRSGDPYDPFTSVTGNSIDIVPVTDTYDDLIGMPSREITYYRLHQRTATPCGSTITQVMSIDCSSGSPTFVTNTLIYTLSNTTITSQRGSAGPQVRKYLNGSPGVVVASLASMMMLLN
jgi:hypothetical protein